MSQQSRSSPSEFIKHIRMRQRCCNKANADRAWRILSSKKRLSLSAALDWACLPYPGHCHRKNTSSYSRFASSSVSHWHRACWSADEHWAQKMPWFFTRICAARCALPVCPLSDDLKCFSQVGSRVQFLLAALIYISCRLDDCRI